MTASVLLPSSTIFAAAAPGDRYEVRVKYFHPMHFDTVNGRYVLELPTVVPKVNPVAAAGAGVCVHNNGVLVFWQLYGGGQHATLCAKVHSSAQESAGTCPLVLWYKCCVCASCLDSSIVGFLGF